MRRAVSPDSTAAGWRRRGHRRRALLPAGDPGCLPLRQPEAKLILFPFGIGREPRPTGDSCCPWRQRLALLTRARSSARMRQETASITRWWKARRALPSRPPASPSKRDCRRAQARVWPLAVQSPLQLGQAGCSPPHRGWRHPGSAAAAMAVRPGSAGRSGSPPKRRASWCWRRAFSQPRAGPHRPPGRPRRRITWFPVTGILAKPCSEEPVLDGVERELARQVPCSLLYDRLLLAELAAEAAAPSWLRTRPSRRAIPHPATGW